MRHTSKEYRAIRMQMERITLTEAAAAVKYSLPRNWGATHPAYMYTVLCPDPRYRSRPKRIGGEAIAYKKERHEAERL